MSFVTAEIAQQMPFANAAPFQYALVAERRLYVAMPEQIEQQGHARSKEQYDGNGSTIQQNKESFYYSTQCHGPAGSPTDDTATAGTLYLPI